MFTEYMCTYIRVCVCVYVCVCDREKEIIYLSKFQSQKLIVYREQSRKKLALF